jgi:hypothetical protein
MAKEDRAAWQVIATSAIDAMRARIALWDGVYASLEARHDRE